MSRIFGVNVLSLWPWSAGRKGIERAVKMAKEVGFDGLQVLPLRGWDSDLIQPYLDFVISQEDAFANGPFIECLVNSVKVFLKLSKIASPRLEDWLFFGKNKHLRMLSGVIKCVHSLEDYTDVSQVLEIKPELSTSSRFYVDHSYEDYWSFCIDTRHIQRPSRRNGELKIDDPYALLDGIKRTTVKLIHVQPMRLGNKGIDDEKFDLAYGSTSHILAKFGEIAPSVPAILEAIPLVIKKPYLLVSPKKAWDETVKYLSDLLLIIKHKLGG